MLMRQRRFWSSQNSEEGQKPYPVSLLLLLHRKVEGWPQSKPKLINSKRKSIKSKRSQGPTNNQRQKERCLTSVKIKVNFCCSSNNFYSHFTEANANFPC